MEDPSITFLTPPSFTFTTLYFIYRHILSTHTLRRALWKKERILERVEGWLGSRPSRRRLILSPFPAQCFGRSHTIVGGWRNQTDRSWFMEQTILEKRILTRESLVFGPALEKAAKSWGKMKNFASSSSSSSRDPHSNPDKEEICSFFRDMNSYKLDMR